MTLFSRGSIQAVTSKKAKATKLYVTQIALMRNSECHCAHSCFGVIFNLESFLTASLRTHAVLHLDKLGILGNFLEFYWYFTKIAMVHLGSSFGVSCGLLVVSCSFLVVFLVVYLWLTCNFFVLPTVARGQH